LPLDHLDLRATRASGAALARLQRLTQLTFDGPQVVDADLEGLSRLKKLEMLYLRSTSINGSGLAHFRDHPRLSFLFLGGNDRLRDAELAHLEHVPHLGQLHLPNAAIGDEALQHLGKCPRLWELDLNHTRVSDEGLKALSKLPGLTILVLSQTTVSDQGLKHLLVHKLQQLHLRNTTRVSPEGIAALKKALPGCQVH
jgi:internalin A